MEPCPPSPSRSTRSRRPDRSRRARRAAAAVGCCALAVATGAAAWNLGAGPLAPGSAARSFASAGLAELARLAASPPRQRLVVYTLLGAALLCVPLAFVTRRRREQERRRRVLATLQQARAPQVFEAARATRPLRRGAQPDAAEARAQDALPMPPLLPEVAAYAAELRADAVREAAARAVMLRAASERSEARRRAAALRTRARLEPGAASPAPDAAAATVEVPVAAALASARPEAKPAPASVAAPQREVARLAATNPPHPAPRAAAPAAPAPGASTQPSGSSSSAASTEDRGATRVALLRSSGPLTFEWLEQCLARDPEDVQARLDLCTALLVAERYSAAERVAREGLERDANNGRLLLRLSEALTGQDRSDEALEVAIRAVRTHRSRKAILHLTRLSAVARRFSPADGARLRKALETRPNDPVFLHALGAFEAQHGDPREALPILRLSLRQERNPRWRRVVSREIARLRADELGASGAKLRRAAG